MGCARAIISNELLSQMLFPEGAKIRRMRHEESPVMRDVPDFEMVIEHPDLPAVDDGNFIPLASPRYECNTEYPSGAPTFLGWGLPSEGQNS